MKTTKRRRPGGTCITGESRIAALVMKGADLKIELDEAKERFDEVKKELIDVAKERRGRFKTVYLSAPSVKAKVQFTSTVQWDTQDLEKAKGLIGPRAFVQYFREETVYRPLRAVNKLMKEKGQSKIQKLIARAMRVKEVAPKLSFEDVED